MKYGRSLYLHVIVNLIAIFSNLSEIVEGRLISLSYMQKLDKSPVSIVFLFLRQKTPVVRISQFFMALTSGFRLFLTGYKSL